MKRFRVLLPWIIGVVGVSGVLAAVDFEAKPLSGWPAYAVLCAISAGLIWLSWRWVAGRKDPRWLAVALGLALVLRMSVGVALVYALPRFGYDTKPQRAGYVFFDAYTRDTDAWSLATSDEGLLSAFTEQRRSDQYGGLLFLSALTYRLLSPGVHRPLLIVLISAVISSLAVLFTWGFARLCLGRRASIIAAWIVALYPDAILLGASQMREPFIGTALAIALYGHGFIRRGLLKQGLISILGSTVILVLPISPPFAFAIIGVVGLAWLWEVQRMSKRHLWLLLLLAIVALVAIFLIIRVWSTIENLTETGIGILLEWWNSVGGQWQRNLLAMQSDVIKSVFRITPDWADLPLIVAYGLVRPFLPAALHDRGLPVWQAIAIWRSLGWFALLPFLLYAPLAAIRGKGIRSLPSYLSFLVWGTALAVSYRGGGDMWDNPRYRTVFLTAQAALAGWAWIHARRYGSPWLHRTWLLVGFATVSFWVWYRGRAGWPIIHSLWITIFITGALVLLYVSGTALFDALRKRRESNLTNPPSEL